MRGTTPVGVAVPSGAMRMTLSPTRTLSSRASAPPRMVAKEPLLSSSRLPAVRCWASPVALRSSAGSTPRTLAPAIFWPCANIAWLSM